ncbi:hypothetical protein GMA8713_01524 [Grimontia marina]|uniref:ABM domain-containing protein n=1 Tax=Grimontia marina TaxID=646534 RepID=A0A128F1C2_9GAMM|nr:hypothetical protein GMA8713_01524 [Grimontia marina]
MILEVAILNVLPSQKTEFETAFAKAQTIISAQKGYISHEVRRCL